MSKAKKWMPIAEAIEHVMKVEKCSHYDAVAKLAEASQKGKLPFKKVKEKPPKQLKPAEAAARLDDDPSSVAMTLTDFRRRGQFTHDEVLGELRAGRLIATATDATWFQIKVTGEVLADQIFIQMDEVMKWMTNPETPAHLLAQWRGNLEERRH
jgi:hypothetical protein